MITLARAYELREKIEQASAMLGDEDALEAPELFPAWAEGVAYEADVRVRYNGVLYKCLQAHTSQAGWTPVDAASLWARVLIPDPEVIPVWEQPDSTNPYMTGDRVYYPDENGSIYESLVDNNIWSPEAYPAGWQLVTEGASGDSGDSTESGDETEVLSQDGAGETVTEWAQPTAADPYMTGDRVLYNGSVYESTIDNNVWDPESYPAGWTIVE